MKEVDTHRLYLGQKPQRHPPTTTFIANHEEGRVRDGGRHTTQLQHLCSLGLALVPSKAPDAQ